MMMKRNKRGSERKNQDRQEKATDWANISSDSHPNQVIYFLISFILEKCIRNKFNLLNLLYSIIPICHMTAKKNTSKG